MERGQTAKKSCEKVTNRTAKLSSEKVVRKSQAKKSSEMIARKIVRKNRRAVDHRVGAGSESEKIAFARIRKLWERRIAKKSISLEPVQIRNGRIAKISFSLELAPNV